MLFPCEVKFKGTGHGCSPCLGFMAGGSLVQPPYCPASSDVPHFTLLLFLNHYIHINDTFGAVEDTLLFCNNSESCMECSVLSHYCKNTAESVLAGNMQNYAFLLPIPHPMPHPSDLGLPCSMQCCVMSCSADMDGQMHRHGMLRKISKVTFLQDNHYFGFNLKVFTHSSGVTIFK